MSTSNPKQTPFDIISTVERSCSVFSLLGCIFIIGTFCLDKAFRKPINRLVFYASFGNLMTNVATLMARSFIDTPGSAGCQFQAFMIQMFMPADALWTMAMALNVYLTFYHKFDAHRLRKMDVAYMISCYGIPFIIALTFIFISTPERGRFYGNAVLWCWVSPKWDIFRIATFYGPVWIVTLITFFIYLRAGSDIYKRHKQLRDFSWPTHLDTEAAAPAPVGDAFSSTRTTEVLVTTEIVDHNAMNMTPLGGPSSGLPRRGSRTSSSLAPKRSNTTTAAYSVTISSNANANANPNSPSSNPNRNRTSYSLPIQSNSNASSPIERPQTSSESANRNTSTLTSTSVSNGPSPRRRAAYEANSAILSYTKCALLFFTAMLVTWIPSSANRVFGVVHDGQTSMTLEIMSTAVLPLQGFWNAIIYAVTSWKAVKMLFNGQGDLITTSASGRAKRGGGERIFMSRGWTSNRAGVDVRRGSGGPKVEELMGVRPGLKVSTGSNNSTEKKFNYGYGYNYGYNYESNGDSESMTELARSRSNTDTTTPGTSRPTSNDQGRDSTPTPELSPLPRVAHLDSPILTRF
ncbi:hypothetical protein V8F20_000975 [Naviculisporaceae sp. PSN 640]